MKIYPQSGPAIQWISQKYAFSVVQIGISTLKTHNIFHNAKLALVIESSGTINDIKDNGREISCSEKEKEMMETNIMTVTLSHYIFIYIVVLFVICDACEKCFMLLHCDLPYLTIFSTRKKSK